MKEVLAKMGWSIVPILLFIVLGGLIGFLFHWILQKKRDRNLKRVVKAFSFTILGVLLALTLSSYRADVPLSVGAKIDQIRRVEAQIEKTEQDRQEEVSRIREELEQALDQATFERDTHFDLKNKPSELITVTWLNKYLTLAKELSDDSLREDYLRRLNNVKDYFSL